MSNEVIRALKEQNADKGGVPKSVHVIKDENGETYEVTQLGEVFLPTGQYVDMIGDNCRWTLKDDDIVVITYPKTGNLFKSRVTFCSPHLGLFSLNMCLFVML